MRSLRAPAAVTSCSVRGPSGTPLMSAGNRASRSVGNPCEIFQFHGKRHVEVGSERENERVLWAHCAAEAASLDNRTAAGGYVGKKDEWVLWIELGLASIQHALQLLGRIGRHLSRRARSHSARAGSLPWTRRTELNRHVDRCLSSTWRSATGLAMAV